MRKSLRASQEEGFEALIEDGLEFLVCCDRLAGPLNQSSLSEHGKLIKIGRRLLEGLNKFESMLPDDRIDSIAEGLAALTLRTKERQLYEARRVRKR